jgi:hypothetical protein
MLRKGRAVFVFTLLNLWATGKAEDKSDERRRIGSAAKQNELELVARAALTVYKKIQ